MSDGDPIGNLQSILEKKNNGIYEDEFIENTLKRLEKLENVDKLDEYLSVNKQIETRFIKNIIYSHTIKNNLINIVYVVGKSLMSGEIYVIAKFKINGEEYVHKKTWSFHDFENLTIEKSKRIIFYNVISSLRDLVFEKITEKLWKSFYNSFLNLDGIVEFISER